MLQAVETGAGRIEAFFCLDLDDVEEFLIDEGIGHLDRSGNFEYGPELDLGWESVPERSEIKSDAEEHDQVSEGDRS
jgi:hypothetical protein